jgi:Spy/CpxP family protein refolding chaperone
MDEPGKTEMPSQGPAAAGKSRRFGAGRMALLAAAVALAAGTAGSLATSSFGYADDPWRPAFMDGQIDPAEAGKHVERVIKHLAVEVDATPDQTAKLVAIAQAAIKDLLPLRDKVQADRRQAVELFSATTIDRAAIEKLRADHVGLAETASKRIAQAIADAADVLTADQRRTLVERISAWHQGFGWHRD